MGAMTDDKPVRWKRKQHKAQEIDITIRNKELEVIIHELNVCSSLCFIDSSKKEITATRQTSELSRM